VRFYNKRGAAEQWIQEGKQAVKMTRLSCHRFRSNEVRSDRAGRLVEQMERGRRCGARLDAGSYGTTGRPRKGRFGRSKLLRISTNAEVFTSQVTFILAVATNWVTFILTLATNWWRIQAQGFEILGRPELWAVGGSRGAGSYPAAERRLFPAAERPDVVRQRGDVT
jgi:hypothetical protein